MVLAVGWFMILLLAILLTGRLALKQLSLAGSHVIGSPKLIIWVMAVLLLPGTLLHELSHWLAAELVRVPTGKLSLLPRWEEDESVRLGSLQIAPVDPIRRTLVGLAPLLAGLSLLFFLATQLPPALTISAFAAFATPTILATFYLVFAVANSMFSSKKDLEVALFPALILILASVLIWRLPITISLPPAWLGSIKSLLGQLNRALVLVLGLNCLWLGISFLLHRLVHR